MFGRIVLSNRGPFATVLSRYTDGNICDVYGQDEDEAMMMAQRIVRLLNADYDAT